MKESDLYLPLKTFLESQGYEVKAEVNDCDVVAVREEEAPVVVELKLSINLDVVLQAVNRLGLTSKVYVGVPEQCKSLKRRRKHVIKLLKMLGIGLLTIEPAREIGSISVINDPGEYKPRKSKVCKERLLGEFMKRVGDPNLGGMEKRKGIMTAYRQRALAIARLLELQGPTKASDIALILKESKARNILYRGLWLVRSTFTRCVCPLSPWEKGITYMAIELVIWNSKFNALLVIILLQNSFLLAVLG